MNPMSAVLRQSWLLVEGRQDLLAATCYARLFLAHPALREKFPLRLDPAESPMWRAVVAMTLAAFEEQHGQRLADLGRSHRKYGARPEHYDAIGASLIEALRMVAGDAWRAEYDRAWLEAFALVERAMLAGAAADAGPATWTATVVRHERRGPDVACFTCRPDRPLRYRPGQYVSLECGYQPRLWRTYSIANAPRPDGLLDFQVRARGAGWVSGALVRRLTAGDTIRLADPAGDMAVDPGSGRDVVCVAGGTGLAPLKAIVEDMARYNRIRWVHLFLGARDRDDLYDLPALAALAARFPWLSVVPACSADRGYPGERGPVSDVVRRYGPWPRHDFLVAGPAPMVRATLRTLADLRIPSTRIRFDAAILDGAEPERCSPRVDRGAA